MEKAYIVAGYRSAVGKATRGALRFYRPDDLAADVIKHLVGSIEGFDAAHVDDLIVGNAVPEAEQGMQMGRIISLLSLPKSVPGFLINRYCGSGLEAIALASYKIQAGMADCIIAGGTESMSLVPTVGWKTALNPKISAHNPDYYTSMGLTAEEVGKKYEITREHADEFAFNSHQKAIAAIQNGLFKAEIVPVTINETYLDQDLKKKTRTYVFDTDEGPRADTSKEALAKLKPVFANNGLVTAGNSSQTSDGAAFVMVMNEKMLKRYNLTPIASLVSYAAAGCEPRFMGIGPIYAIPKALEKAQLSLDKIDLIELNEAFATQSLAVINEMQLNTEIVNVNGGAISLGHPLGCSGAKLSIQLFNELKRREKKYGMVTACVGGGQGVAGIYEML